MVPFEKKRGRNAEMKQGFYYIYIDANSVINSKQSDGNVDIMQFSEEDIRFIQEVANEEDPFRVIVNSICPGKIKKKIKNNKLKKN